MLPFGSSDAAEDGDAEPTSVSEAGDESEVFSDLREAGRPFGFGDDEFSADPSFAACADDVELDLPEEDTMFLAPRRDFSPAGMARDEGADADIESPFAEEPSSKTTSELMSPVRRLDDELEHSEQVFEAKAPPPEAQPVARMPAERREPSPSMPPASSPLAEPPAHTPPAKKPPPLTSSTALPLDDPSLIRPRPVHPVRPTLVPRAAPEVASQSPGPRRRPTAGGGHDELLSIGVPSPVPVAPKTPPPLEPSASCLSFGDDDAAPRRRQIGVVQPTEAAPPVGPPPPRRLDLALGAFSRGAGASLRGLGAAWTAYFAFCLMLQRGLELAWATYSKGCLALQTRLARSAGWTWSKARSFASFSGAALVRLGHLGGQGCRSGATFTSKAAKVAARHGLVGAKASLSLAGRGVVQAAVHAFAAMRRMLALAGKALGGVGETCERWITASAEQRTKVVEAANAARAAEMVEAAEALKAQVGATSTSPSEASRALSASKVREPASTTKPATSSPPRAMSPKAKKAAATPAPEAAAPPSVDASLNRPGPRLFSWPDLPRIALAAASITCLIMAIILSLTTGPASTAWTFSIPKKPIIGAIPPNRLANLTEGSETAPELEDPIAKMIAFVDARASEPPADPSVSPVLARARTEEGLSQFVRAAEVVGLGELLEPGEAYTIFAPTDEAFASLASGEVDSLLDPTGHERLLTLLSHHILPGRLDVDDLQGGVREHTSLAGKPLRIDATGVMSVGGAGMVDADLQAGNGVLHVIDQVLLITGP